ncbi:hypothetical protein LCGC14_2078170 [marine sediment metagenome]|uniref:Uncharacterized protein n=1 Tax=marine sediment metagenome TaxID=412755 RepID=A0A0F9HDA8_9ZZZZ
MKFLRLTVYESDKALDTDLSEATWKYSQDAALHLGGLSIKVRIHEVARLLGNAVVRSLQHNGKLEGE